MRRRPAALAAAGAAAAEKGEGGAEALKPTFAGKTGAIVGFGSLFFLVHWLFTDSGTIIAWSWAGYPSSGPFAFPHGLITIAALLAGTVLVPVPTRTRATSLASFAAASLC